jgi:hypothetical protein
MSKSLSIFIVIALFTLAATVDAQQPRRGRGRGPFGMRGMMGEVTFLMALREVQEELSVTSQQRELIESLQTDLSDQRRALFRGGPPGLRQGDEGPNELRERMQTLSRQGEKLVMTVLEPDQAERLRQIRLQWEGARALERDEVAKSLALDDTQLKEIRRILSDDSAPDGGEATRNLSREDREARRTAVESQITAVLSPQQQQQWQAMKGQEFKLPEFPTRFGPRSFRGRGPGPR